MLKAVKAGDLVRFVPDRVNGQFTVTKIEKLTAHEGCRKAIDSEVHYYLRNLFDGQGLPRP